MNNFKPFDNDSQSVTVGPDNGVTFENGKDSIVVYGDYTISKNTDPKEIDNIIQMLNLIKENLINTPTNKLK